MDARAAAQYGLTATYERMVRCLADLTDDEARGMPDGLTPIIWQAGHIALTDFQFARRADARSEAPAGYAGLFAAGTGGAAAYPPLAEVRDAAARAHAVLEAVARTADLGAPVEARNYGTIGEMLAFVLYHRGYHVGKMTTLRALLKKARLFG
jgi:hypothetical protein